MSEFPEYDWVQRSIDMTVYEAEEARALSEKLKESGKIGKIIGKEYYFFPAHLVKNPIKPFYFEIEDGDDLTLLEYRLSEN